MRTRVFGLSLLTLLVAFSLALTGCGSNSSGGGGTQPPPSSGGLTIYPAIASVPVGQTAQFAGYVPSQPGATVTWQVTGGSANGTIDSTGKYTSPAAVPSSAQVTITATSGSFSGTATVTVTSAQGLAVNPTAIAVQAGTTTPFTVSGASGQVTWEVNNVLGGDSTYGTIDANGNYSAPLSPPQGGLVTITAVNGGNSGTAAATIVFSNRSLSGHYAFSYTGDDGSGFLAVAGSFVADGDGNITSGMEDVNSYGSGVAAGNPIQSGTYTVGADGRAQATVATGLGSGIVWQFALISNQHGLMIRFDSNATGSGSIDQQNAQGFAIPAGNYSFGLSGLEEFDTKGYPVSIAGLLYTDGLGNFPASGAVEDINYDGTAITTAASPDETLYGSYVFDSQNPTTGRGTIFLTSTSTLFPTTPNTSFTFTFYMVDATHLKVVESGHNDVYQLAGDFFRAPNGPLSASILNGNYVFTTGGSSSIGPYSSAGVFTATGTSSSTSGSISGGVFDSNNSGNVKLAQTLSSSTFNVKSSPGRITFTLSIGTTTLNFAAYPTSTGSIEMLELDSNPITSGVAYLQTSGASLHGSYALNLSGIASTNNGAVEQDIAGQVAPSTNGTLAGTLDINNFEDHGISEGLSLLSGTTIVSPASYGRGTLTLKTSLATFPLAYYIVDNNTVLLFETDSQRVMPGTLVKQF